MANLNKLILAGNITRAPETRVTPGGLAICKFGLAINRTFTDREGNKREETTFIDVDAFGKQAETIAKYLRKGSPILIEGRLKLDQWDDKTTGEKRSKLGAVVESFHFLGGPRPEDQPSAPRATAFPASPPAPATDDPDEDVPF